MRTLKCVYGTPSSILGAPDDYMEYRKYTFPNRKMLLARSVDGRTGQGLSIIDSQLLYIAGHGKRSVGNLL